MHATISNPSDLNAISSAETQPAPLTLIFQELDARNWPVLLLESRLPDLLAHAAELAPEDRCAWISGLGDVWRRHGWALTRQGRNALFELAATWSAWPLAYAAGAELLRDGCLEEACVLRMMDACRNVGDVDAAIDLAVSMQLAHPFAPCYERAHRDLMAWRRWRNSAIPAVGFRLEDENLHLEPLDHYHADEFAWQYYDPAIAELCCLPRFKDDAHWHRWLDGVYAYGDQQIFAVMHRTWGFIGCVSLILQGETGFFYYWIGRDFQGCGFGPRAASLMLDGARRYFGMRTCYAKVYDYNIPSRRALEKMGFEDLGIPAVAPDADQLFYRQGEPQPYERTAAELHAIMEYMGSDIRPATLAHWSFK